MDEVIWQRISSDFVGLSWRVELMEHRVCGSNQLASQEILYIGRFISPNADGKFGNEQKCIWLDLLIHPDSDVFCCLRFPRWQRMVRLVGWDLVSMKVQAYLNRWWFLVRQNDGCFLRISTISLALCSKNTSTCLSRGVPVHQSPRITWQVNAQTLGMSEATGTEQLVVHHGFSKSNQPDPTANLWSSTHANTLV